MAICRSNAPLAVKVAVGIFRRMPSHRSPCAHAAPPAEDLSAAFARALSGQDAPLVVPIGADNNSFSLDETQPRQVKSQLCCALAAKVPFAVEVRPEVLALDADTRDLAEAACDIAGEMEQSGLEPVVVASGQPDRVHVLVVIDDAELREQWRHRAKNAGIDVRRTIRPPLSPHRLGLPGALVEPTSPDEALRRLQQPRYAASGLRARQHLSDKMLSLLRYGDTSQKFPSRSEGIQAFATASVNAGLPFTYFRKVLLDPKNELGQKVRDQPDPDRYLRLSWRSAEKYVAEHPLEDTRREARDTVAAIRRTAADHSWRRVSDQAVLMALCNRAEAVGTVDALDMSVRDIAVEADVDKSTVQRALTRLQDRGWLEQVRAGRGLAASTWKLDTPSELLLQDAHTYSRGGVSHVYASCNGSAVESVPEPRALTDLGADIWAPDGLGKQSAGVLRCLLLHGPATTTELAQLLDVNRSTTHRWTRPLLDEELIRKRDDKRWELAVTPDELEDHLQLLASRLGVAGRREDARARRQDEIDDRVVEFRESSRLRRLAGGE